MRHYEHFLAPRTLIGQSLVCVLLRQQARIGLLSFVQEWGDGEAVVSEADALVLSILSGLFGLCGRWRCEIAHIICQFHAAILVLDHLLFVLLLDICGGIRFLQFCDSLDLIECAVAVASQPECRGCRLVLEGNFPHI